MEAESLIAQPIDKPLSTDSSESHILTKITPNVYISGQLSESELHDARAKYRITDIFYLRRHDEPGYNSSQRRHADRLGMRQIDYQTSIEHATLEGREKAMDHIDRFFSKRAMKTMMPDENYLFMDGENEQQRARLFALIATAKFNKGETQRSVFHKEIVLLEPRYRDFIREYIKRLENPIQVPANE